MTLAHWGEAEQPQYSQEWYVRPFYKNLLEKMVNPQCCWITYAHPVHKGLLKEYGLPRTVAEWYVRYEHRSFTWSALHVTICAAMFETQDRLQRRKERDRLRRRAQETPEERSLAYSTHKPLTIAMYQFLCGEILYFITSVVMLFSLVTFIVFYVTHFSSYECIRNSLKSCHTV